MERPPTATSPRPPVHCRCVRADSRPPQIAFTATALALAPPPPTAAWYFGLCKPPGNLGVAPASPVPPRAYVRAMTLPSLPLAHFHAEPEPHLLRRGADVRRCVRVRGSVAYGRGVEEREEEACVDDGAGRGLGMFHVAASRRIAPRGAELAIPLGRDFVGDPPPVRDGAHVFGEFGDPAGVFWMR